MNNDIKAFLGHLIVTVKLHVCPLLWQL